MKRLFQWSCLILSLWLLVSLALVLTFPERPVDAVLLWTLALALIGFVSWQERD